MMVEFKHVKMILKSMTLCKGLLKEEVNDSVMYTMFQHLTRQYKTYQHEPSIQVQGWKNILEAQLMFETSKIGHQATKESPSLTGFSLTQNIAYFIIRKKLIWEAKNEMQCVPGTHCIDRTLWCK